MNNADFFLGERTIKSVEIFNRHRGKETLLCTIKERWDEKFSDSSTCGELVKFRIKRVFGVTVTERESFETTISSAFGVEGVSEVKSEIKASLGREWQLEETLEEEKEFSFQSPECGRKTLRIFQLKRLYVFSYKNRRSRLMRWLTGRRPTFSETVGEWVNRSWEIPSVEKNIPECNCQPTKNTGMGDLVKLVLGNLGMVLGYEKVEEGIAFPHLGVSIPAKNIQEALFANVTFPREALPPYLLFLADEKAETLTGTLLPYHETRVTKPASEPVRRRAETERRYSKKGSLRKGSRREKENFPSGLIYLLIGGGIGAAITMLLSSQSRQSSQISIPAHGIKVEKSIIVNLPPEELYRFWRNFENLPRFMNHLESVVVTGSGRSHWVAKAPAGTTVEWDAEIYNEREGELIAWRSIEGADVDNAGAVHFTPARGGQGTEVRVVLKYDPPGGALGVAVARLFGEEPSIQIEEDLRRFKQLMEIGGVTASGYMNSSNEAHGAL